MRKNKKAFLDAITDDMIAFFFIGLTILMVALVKSPLTNPNSTSYDDAMKQVNFNTLILDYVKSSEQIISAADTEKLSSYKQLTVSEVIAHKEEVLQEESALRKILHDQTNRFFNGWTKGNWRIVIDYEPTITDKKKSSLIIISRGDFEPTVVGTIAVPVNDGTYAKVILYSPSYSISSGNYNTNELEVKE